VPQDVDKKQLEKMFRDAAAMKLPGMQDLPQFECDGLIVSENSAYPR